MNRNSKGKLPMIEIIKGKYIGSKYFATDFNDIAPQAELLPTYRNEFTGKLYRTISNFKY